MNRLRLEQYKGLQPQETQYYSNAYNLANQMMTGGQLPGYLGTVAGGLSPETIGNQAALYAQQNMPGFQSLGLGDSGVAYNQVARGIANEVLLPTSEYNSNLLLNMLNLATGQSAQGTNQFTSGSQQLAGQLAGLRSYQTTSSNTQTRNPFLESFYGSAGSGLGNIFNPQTYIGSGGVWG
jgi:hypothetical protein